MKTVTKKINPVVYTPLLMLGFVGLISLSPVNGYAATPMDTASAPANSQDQASSTTTASASTTAKPSLPPKVAPPPPPTPAQLSGTQAPSSVAEKSDTLEGAEAKVPSSVKSVMHHLDNAVENVTINDLNTARQAIAKIDILIELEKKMAELDKIRQERETKSMAAALPASALNPNQPGGQVMPASMMMASGGIDLVRVVGVAGHYRAVIKAGYDSDKTVDVGDAISDGEVVSSISPTSITLDRRGIKHVVRIKNVDKVFGGSP